MLGVRTKNISMVDVVIISGVSRMSQSAKVEAKVEAKREAKVEAKGDAKMEAKGEAKCEAKGASIITHATMKNTVQNQNN